jgi:hypothetical protein
MNLAEEISLADIGCGSCGATDWVHDGFAVYPDAGGAIHRERFAPSGHATETRWLCRGCNAVVDDEDPTARRLSTIQASHFE